MRTLGRPAKLAGYVFMASMALVPVTMGSAQAPGAAASSQTQGQPPSGQTPHTPGDRRGQFAGMERVAGEVTAVSNATVTIKSEDGNTVQIVTTENTRLMKDRAPVKVADLHLGDGVMAFGNMDAPNHTLHAAMLMATDAAQLKAMRENLGKTYITGRVTAIDLDNAKMTVERQDRVPQTIGFDESTSFKRAVRGASSGGTAGGGQDGGGQGGGGPRYGGGGMGMSALAGNAAAMERAFATGESITLADIKVGDFVVGTGSVKNGVFVPARLMDSPPGQRRRQDGAAPGAAGGAPAPPPSAPGPGAH